MTVTGGDAPEEQTRVDLEPALFPRVPGGTEPAERVPGESAPSIFSRPATEPLIETEAPAAAGRPARSGKPTDTRLPWMVALIATLGAFAVLAGIFLAVAPRPGTPSLAAQYAPAGAVAYVEMRLDLPGDQRDRLISFMSKFPGFADPANFDRKFDDTLNEMLRRSDMGLDWYTDVDPWFGGLMSVFSSSASPTVGTPPSITMALGIKDRARLDEVIQQRTAGADATQEDYQGQQIWTVTGGPDHQRVSLAVTDEVLLVGMRIEDVKAALDVRQNRSAGLADDQFFVQQLGALHADRLGTFYYDGRAVVESMRGQIGATIPGGDMLDWVVDAAAVRVLGEMRAETDHLAVTVRTERPTDVELPPLPANKSTNLAGAVSADSIFYAEFRQVGQDIGFAFERLLEPSASGGSLPVDMAMLEQFLGTAPHDFFDFVDDVAVSVAYPNNSLEAGLVATVDDEVIARQRVDRLISTLSSLAAFGGGVTVEEQRHGDATITVIGVGSLLGGSPISSVSVTVSSGRMLLGVGDFVVNALDRTSADSLAARAEYSTAVAAGGSANAGVMYLDIAALRGVVEGMIPPPMRALYEQQQKPFVTPLSHMVVISTTEGPITVGHMFLYVE